MRPRRKNTWLEVAVICQFVYFVAVHSYRRPISSRRENFYDRFFVSGFSVASSTLSKPDRIARSSTRTSSIQLTYEERRVQNTSTSNVGGWESVDAKKPSARIPTRIYTYAPRDWHGRIVNGILDKRKYTRRSNPRHYSPKECNRTSKYPRVGRPTTYNQNSIRRIVLMSTYRDPDVPIPLRGRPSKHPLVTLHPNDTRLVRATGALSVFPEYFSLNPTTSRYTTRRRNCPTRHPYNNYKIHKNLSFTILRPYISRPRATGSPGRHTTYNPTRKRPWSHQTTVYDPNRSKRPPGRPTIYPLATLFANDTKLFRVAYTGTNTTKGKYFRSNKFWFTRRVHYGKRGMVKEPSCQEIEQPIASPRLLSHQKIPAGSHVLYKSS
jgi:hypothetical protein